MARCPQCDRPVELNAERCGSCLAVFNTNRGWRPLPENTNEAVELKRLYPDAAPTLGGIVGMVVARLFLAFLAVAGFWVLAVLSAIPYGGGNRDLIAFTATFTLFMFAWALLPLVRYSRIAAIFVGLAWAGVGLSMFPYPGFAGWLAATVGVAFCLAKTPPVFWATGAKPQSARSRRA